MFKHKQSAFTLIELLVVISIIALLIAILLPALGAARRSASASDCLSRMRSVAIAMTAYEVDNKGYLPRAHGGNPTVFTGFDGGYYLSDYLEEYMEISDDQTTDYYLCPDSTLDPAAGQKRLSYSGFRNILVNRDSDPDKRVRVDDIKRPTGVIAYGDAAQNSGAGTSGPNFTGAYVGPYTDPALRDQSIDFPEALNDDGLAAPDNGYHFRFRHNANKTGNASFIDGHAESFAIGQIKQENFATDY